MPFINGKFVVSENTNTQNAESVNVEVDQSVDIEQEPIESEPFIPAEYEPNHEAIAMHVEREKQKNKIRYRNYRAKPYITVGLVLSLGVMFFGLYASNAPITVFSLIIAFLLSCSYYILIPRK